MDEITELLVRFAGHRPIFESELVRLNNAGLIYNDGLCVQLTEAGRRRLTLGLQGQDDPPSAVGKLTDQQLREAKGMFNADALSASQVKAQSEKLSPGAVKLTESAKDIQIGGDHYKKLGQYQPWEVLAAWMTPEELRGYMKGTVIAYLAREQDKGRDTDVAKALHTMQLWQDVRKDK